MQERLLATSTTTTQEKTITKILFQINIYEKENNPVAKQPVHFIA